MNNYCLPIIKKDKKNILEIIEKNKNEYSYFEIWLDYIQDINEDFIENLIQKYPNKIIFLFRRQDLEKNKMAANKRKGLLILLENKKAFIDLDISQQEELNFLDISKYNLILSYHNYTKTPENENLQKIIKTMEKYNPSIYKISTFCINDQDPLGLLNLLLQLKAENKKFIILGMGPKGLITRIFGSILGNELIFAPRKAKEQSAKGQLTLKQFKTIFSTIKA